MDVSERCERLAKCRAKFQDIADRGADVNVQYVVREHWHVVSGDPHRAIPEIVDALAVVAAALLRPGGSADDWWWHVARLPGSTPRHPYEITEAARCSAAALRRLELSLEPSEPPDASFPSNSFPRVGGLK